MLLCFGCTMAELLSAKHTAHPSQPLLTRTLTCRATSISFHIATGERYTCTPRQFGRDGRAKDSAKSSRPISSGSCASRLPDCHWAREGGQKFWAEPVVWRSASYSPPELVWNRRDVLVLRDVAIGIHTRSYLTCPARCNLNRPRANRSSGVRSTGGTILRCGLERIIIQSATAPRRHIWSLSQAAVRAESRRMHRLRSSTR